MAETTTTEEVLNPSNPIPNFFSNPENTEQQPPSTIGIFHQHTALHVNDFDRTVNFYEKVLGFRVAFKIEWETYKLAYLGYPQDPAKPDIPLDSITHEGGFLEILWYEGSTKPQSFRTLSHLGFIVPDMKEFIKRMKEHNVKVVKKPGAPPNDDLAEIYGFPKGQLPVWFSSMLSKHHAFIVDSEGYYIEVGERGVNLQDPPGPEAYE